MDEFLSQVAKFLSSTIVVEIYSYPNFSIEILLAGIICVVHTLLLKEVNNLVRRTNARMATKLRIKHSLKDVESSYHSLARIQTDSKKIDGLLLSKPYCVSCKRLSKKISTSSNFGWIVPHGDTLLRPTNFNRKDHYDRIEHLLSITPSEYVRRDKERKNKNLGLRTCIQSLTSLLEKALNNEMSLETLSKDAIKRSINTIRENFENQICEERYQLSEFPTPSLQSLITHSAERNALKFSLAPSLLTHMNCNAHNIEFSYSNIETKLNELKNNGMDDNGRGAIDEDYLNSTGGGQYINMKDEEEMEYIGDQMKIITTTS